MKRGHIILISGAALLVAGIIVSAVWGMSFASLFVRDNTIVARTSIDPGKSIEAKTDVNELDRSISLAIGIDRAGQQPSSPPSDIRLKETMTDPNGKVVSSAEFGEAFLTSFKPEVTGTYTVTVTNLGTKPVIFSGTFGHMPFMGPDGKPDIDGMMDGQALGMIIAGGGLAAIGVVTLIVGAIIAVVDSRSGNSITTSTSEGGITYRKE